ncbi:MAG: 4a-hydroxytetrahydrobiopterin dehydratase [Flavobacterium sp.]|nr:4a-hydroxytetrahydrobiopterin dehydratase [Pedobacter sp.]
MNWKEENFADGSSVLFKEFKFNNFIDAWAFMSSVALLAEKVDHHPDWTNVYNKVSIRLSTHDVDNQITEKDRNLALEIDKLGLG